MSETLAPQPPTHCASRWAHGPWAGCHTADDFAARARVLNRRWWEQGGWLIYLYYRILDPTLPALTVSLAAFSMEPEPYLHTTALEA